VRTASVSGFLVAFLARKLKECVEIYRKIGLRDPPLDPQRANFANVGEQLLGFADAKRSFIDGRGGYTKSLIHVSFEVPSDKLDECVAFLNENGVKTRGQVNERILHRSGRNIMELWAPE
jgi:hypothetical protein